jgi:hypothetical protein
MRKLVFLLSIAVLVACNQNSKTTESTEVKEEATVASLSDFFDNIDNSVDSVVKITGLVDHVCKHGGQRMFIVDTSDNRLKITTGESISEFEVDLEGKDVIVLGIVEEQRIDSVYLAEWEAEVKEGSEDHESGIHDGEHAEEENEVMAKINKYREQIKESEKGYLSFYSVKANSFEVTE